MTLGSISPAPSAEDLARGWVCGRLPPLPPPATSGGGFRRALDDALRPALERPPCGILFSGGRDSSVLLAAAIDLARREGHPPPIALTFRLDHPDTREDAWQQAIWTWVGRPEWSRLAMDDAFDLLGPVARAELRRRGVWWPALVHNAVPALELVRGGSLIDGEGGDEAFGIKRSAILASMVHRRRPPGLRSIDNLLAELGPMSLRRRAAVHDAGVVPRSWLRPAAAAAFEEDLVRDSLTAPLWWDEAVPATGRRRALEVAVAAFDATAAAHDVERHHPFADPAVLGALGEAGGRLGWHARTEALRAVVPDLLPDAALRRVSKATFRDAAFGPAAQAFAREWDGSGLPVEVEALVDVDELVRVARGAPVPGIFPIVQTAWLASQAAAAEPPARPVVVSAPTAADDDLPKIAGWGGEHLPAARPLRDRLERALDVALLVLIELGLRKVRLPRLIRLLGGRLADDAPPAAVLDAGLVLSGPRFRQWQLAIASFSRSPFPDTCLRRSLLLTHRLRGLDPEVRIGVKRAPSGALEAHAWVEVLGWAIDPQAELFSTMGATS